MATTCFICEDDCESYVTLACNHIWCTDCIRTAFANARQEAQFPPQCCTAIDMDDDKIRCILDDTVVQELLESRRQWAVPVEDRVYCSNRDCNRFIYPNAHVGNSANCAACMRTTCKKCKLPQHEGACEEDPEARGMAELAASQGWGQCRKCKLIIERKGGCPHLTCPCRHQFCLFCQRDWRECKGDCEGCVRDAQRMNQLWGDENPQFGEAGLAGFTEADFDTMHNGLASITPRPARDYLLVRTHIVFGFLFDNTRHRGNRAFLDERLDRLANDYADEGPVPSAVQIQAAVNGMTYEERRAFVSLYDRLLPIIGMFLNDQ